LVANEKQVKQSMFEEQAKIYSFKT